MHTHRTQDWRELANGAIMPTEPGGYCDQPSVVVAKDGTWVGTVTTAKGEEGARDQYVSILRSSDRGQSWSAPQRLEPQEQGRYWESSYSKLFIAPGGRIFCFYCYNSAHATSERSVAARYDMGGAFCMRYSDDNGLSWSARIEIPVREFEVDRYQPILWQGQPYRLFWNVSRPYFEQGKLYVPLSKVSHKDGFMAHTEGVLLCSDTVLYDPEHAVWHTLPEGEVGIRGVPGGAHVSEELSFVMLSDGTIQTTTRTVDGYACTALSRDGGRSFTQPRYLTYPDGRFVKNSRAANFLWKIDDGKYLYWFTNCSYPGYYTRNPAWLCAAVEVDTPQGKQLQLSQPEVLLYHPSAMVGFSYPDLILDGGRYFVTETQKTTARTHEIPAAFIDMLFSQFTLAAVHPDAILCDTHAHTADLPELEPFIRLDLHAGEDCQVVTGAAYTLECWVEFTGAQVLYDTVSTMGQGLRVEACADGSLRIFIRDLRECTYMDTRAQVLQAGLRHLCIVLDGASRVLCIIVDGLLEDGGSQRVAGWGLISRSITGIGGRRQAQLGTGMRRFRLYGKALTTTQCIGNYRAGVDA